MIWRDSNLGFGEKLLTPKKTITDTSGGPFPNHHERLFAVASVWTSAFAVVLERKRTTGEESFRGCKENRKVHVDKGLSLGVGSRDMG